jgi:hypothetical protein
MIAFYLNSIFNVYSRKICIQCILHPTLKLFKTVEKKTISSLKHVYYFLIKLELKINFNL